MIHSKKYYFIITNKGLPLICSYQKIIFNDDEQPKSIYSVEWDINSKYIGSLLYNGNIMFKEEIKKKLELSEIQSIIQPYKIKYAEYFV